MAGDSNWPSVALLLPFDGGNGFASTVDRSPTPKAISFAGNAKISTTQSKFGDSSLYLDGTGDYLTCGAAANWTQMHTSSAKWTFEAWVKPDNWTGAKSLFSTNEGASANHGVYCGINASTRTVNLQVTRGVSASFVVNGSFSGVFPNDSNWHHVAITYDQSLGSANATLWIDGVASGTLSKTANAPSASAATAALKVGGFATTGDYAGYIDDLRVTLGVVRYAANFTPPDSAFVPGMGQVIGTVRDDAGALCSRMVRAYRRGTGAMVAQAYTQAGDSNIRNVALLLHGDNTNGSTTIVDTSPSPKAITLVGTPSISTAQSRFGEASIYFGGTADALSVAHSPDINLASGDFTIEAWVYFSSLAIAQTILQKDQSFGTTFTSYSIHVGTTGALVLQMGTGNGATYSQAVSSAAGTVTAGAWHHIAVTRSGNTVRLFVGGVQVGVGTLTGTPVDGGKPLIVGRYPAGGGAADGWMFGHIDELRITKGLARYTANFTPPADRFPDNNLDVGNYLFNLPTLDEVNVIAYDDSAGNLYNDIINRVIPA